MLELLLNSKSRYVLLNAYPGFGKTRLAIQLCKKILKKNHLNTTILILTKSKVETYQIYDFILTENLHDKTILLLGRDELCPFKARSYMDCMLLRSNNYCNARSKKLHMNIYNYRDLYFKYQVCPYEYVTSKLSDKSIIVTVHAYLSNPELYSILLKVLRDKKYYVIIDEYHNIAFGIDHVEEIPLSKITYWARLGSKLAREILNKIVKVRDDKESIILPSVSMLDMRAYAKNVVNNELLNELSSDLCTVTYCRNDDTVKFRCLSITPIIQLLSKCEKAFLLTASVSRKFLNLIFLKDNLTYIDIHDISNTQLRNLKIVVIKRLRLTFRDRFLTENLSTIFNIIKNYIESSPLIGGHLILFSSREYLKYFTDKYFNELSKLNTKIYVMMSSEESKKQLQNFKSMSKKERCLGLSYINNPISEGLNFKGEELLGVILVGFPIPQINDWNNLKVKIYNKLGINGLKVTYLFPAISLTIQAIGRLLRDLDVHKKIAILIDERFWKFRSYYPKWLIKILKLLSLETLYKELKYYWIRGL